MRAWVKMWPSRRRPAVAFQSVSGGLHLPLVPLETKAWRFAVAGC